MKVSQPVLRQSQLGIEHPTLRKTGERSNQLHHHRGGHVVVGHDYLWYYINANI